MRRSILALIAIALGVTNIFAQTKTIALKSHSGRSFFYYTQENDNFGIVPKHVHPDSTIKKKLIKKKKPIRQKPKSEAILPKRSKYVSQH